MVPVASLCSGPAGLRLARTVEVCDLDELEVESVLSLRKNHDEKDKGIVDAAQKKGLLAETAPVRPVTLAMKTCEPDFPDVEKGFKL